MVLSSYCCGHIATCPVQALLRTVTPEHELWTRSSLTSAVKAYAGINPSAGLVLYLAMKHACPSAQFTTGRRQAGLYYGVRYRSADLEASQSLTQSL